METFERITIIIKAEMNDSLNNPEKVVSRNIKELETTIARLRQSIIKASSEKKRVQEKYDYSVSEIARWEKRAWLAVSANNDYLAKEALLRKQYFKKNATELEIQIKLDQNTGIINNLRHKLTALETRVIELKTLEARQYSSKAQKLLQTSMSNTSSAMIAFERMEEKIKLIEAESELAKKLGGVNIEQEFAALNTSSNTDDELVIIKEQLIEGFSNSAEYISDDVIDAELDELRAQLND